MIFRYLTYTGMILSILVILGACTNNQSAKVVMPTLASIPDTDMSDANVIAPTLIPEVQNGVNQFFTQTAQYRQQIAPTETVVAAFNSLLTGTAEEIGATKTSEFEATRAEISTSAAETLIIQNRTATAIATIHFPETLPAVTADPGCPQAETWWNSQQVQSNYTYFTEQVMDAASSSNNIAALTEQMRIHRDFVANFPADACLTEAKAALLKAFDATIAVARATNIRDQAALAEQQPAETQAYANLAAVLREVGVNLVPPAASG